MNHHMSQRIIIIGDDARTAGALRTGRFPLAAAYLQRVKQSSTGCPPRARALATLAALLCVLASGTSRAEVRRASGLVDFNLPDRPLEPGDFRSLFGNFRSNDAFTDIVDGALRVRFPKGRMIKITRFARI